MERLISDSIMMKSGVQCLICSKILSDKSNYNRHHASCHKEEGIMKFEVVIYNVSQGIANTQFDWTFDALPQASAGEKEAAPGLLERETKILSKAVTLFSAEKWTLGEPSVGLQDEATSYIDSIDELALLASTLLRAQVMRSKSGNIKIVPFQPLKDCSGAQYAKTLAWFKLFAQEHFQRHGSMQEFVHLALEEKCNAQDVCCLEGFIYWSTLNIPNFKNADPLQHAAMHMRRVLRGTAMLYLSQNSEKEVEPYCNLFLNPTKGVSFGVLTTMYYEIKRCVPHDKRLLIQRSDSDEGYPAGSAVNVRVPMVLDYQIYLYCAGGYRSRTGQSDMGYDAVRHQSNV
jgi:hypothetical protein